ncbi:MAG: hypothetical protein HXY35_17335 [Chloroflexi bacterium]|nr:hypothetical protein [Chloroflexota bacterium]
MPHKRPFGVTLLLWMVLSLSVWGAARFVASLRWWGVLSEFEYGLSPVYLSIAGAGWVVAGGVVIWAAMNHRRWAHPALPIFLIGWLFQYWVERLFFQAERSNLPFAVILSVIFLAVTLACALHRSTKIFFTKSEEHEHHKQHSTSE